MKYHLPIHPSLVLSLLSVAFAIDPKAVSLRRREPAPAWPWACCRAGVDTTYELGSASRTSAEQSRSPVVETTGDVSTLGVVAKTTDERILAPLRGPYPKPLDGQVRSPEGNPVVASIIILHPKYNQVLLIKDSFDQTGGWRFPEGYWTEKERDLPDVAAREARDTAGFIVNRNAVQHVFNGAEATEHSTTSGPEYHYFKARAEMIRYGYPESQRWERQWFTYSEAVAALTTHHEEQLRMLEKVTQD